MKSFNEIYEKVYKESNTTLEQARNKATNGMLLIIFIILMVGTIFSVITKSFLLIFMALLIIALYIAFSRNRRNYTKLFKEKVIRTFVKEYSSTLEYLPSKGIGKLSYIKGEFERPDRFFSEDLITGTLEDGNRISMSEVISEIESRDSDGNVEYLTIFYGLFAEIKLNKTVLANIKIRKNSFTLIKPKDKIEMDSSEFEKVFNVYGTNPIITMQLLTADVMQMLIDFKEQNRFTPEITINENNMYIRFNTGEVFEANMLKKALDYDTLLKYYNIINFTLELTEKILKNIKEI